LTHKFISTRGQILVHQKALAGKAFGIHKDRANFSHPGHIVSISLQLPEALLLIVFSPLELNALSLSD
jgi:hypothetical protein